MNIVLVHGFLGFSEMLGVEYFRGVAGHLRDQGFAVLVPQLDPAAGIEVRGTQLRDQMLAAHNAGELDSNATTHIVAHSMGGLDSRFILSPVNPDRIRIPVRSLTTISTPHLGSPVADWIGNPGALGISSDGLRDLTTARCAAFSAKYGDDPAVAYFSAAGSGRLNPPATSAPLLLLHGYIQAVAGQQNDGLVSVDSARWGTFDPVTWHGDHVEEVGYNLDNMLVPPAFYMSKYDEIVVRLSAL